MIHTVLHGAGRMAQSVLAELQEHPQFELVAIVSRSEPVELLSSIKQDIQWFSSLESIRANTDTDNDVDLLIDFTLPGGPATAAPWCLQNGIALLSGTTGLNDEDQRALKSAAAEVPVLWASNMSKGIALISALARQAEISLGDAADITISDIHHQYKQDAPSGTALTLAEVVMKGRAKSILPEVAMEDRVDSPATTNEQEEGHEEGEIAFISIRKGEVIGQHTISFELPGEIVEISHKVRDRSVFAKGVLNAGVWLSTQKPGYYSTSDWLNIG